MRKADNLPLSCVVTKSGNLDFLEPSGPVQACNGTALPFYKQWSDILNFIQTGPERQDYVRRRHLHHVRATMLRAAGDCMEHVHQGQDGECLGQKEAAGGVHHENVYRHRNM